MLLCNENAISSGNYIIGNSLRFQSASSQYLNRTPASAGNRTTWTWSAWVKRGNIGSVNGLLTTTNSSTVRTNIGFNSDSIDFYEYNAAVTARLTTTPVYRDPSAWYHVVAVWDTTQATSSNRMKLYVNGLQITAFSTATYPALNATSNFNNNVASALGAFNNAAPPELFLDGYLSEVNFIDGQALTPSSFGTTDATSGQWVAKKYTGTYGTNGFYLPFSNGTSTTTLGADSSGNGNNWTLTNFTRSAGVSDCWMKDVPSGNGGASGTQPSGNYAVYSSISNPTANITISNANLKVTAGGVSAQWRTVVNTISANASKWYAEFTLTTTGGSGQSAVSLLSNSVNYSGNFFPGNIATGYSYLNDGTKVNNGSQTSYGSTYTTGDVIGIAYDGINNKVWFSKNGVWQASGDPAAGTNQAYTTTAGEYYITVGGAGTTASVWDTNFGQRSFAYTPPSGFKALCTANLPVATIKQGNKYMDATLYSGNLIGQAITNAAGFKPDLVWVKSRSAATDNKLTDSNRGAQKALISNSTAAETTDLTGVTSFNTNGFTLGTSTTYNNTGATYVGWQWQAGKGTTSSNTNGSITSTVSVNATAGFSVATFTTPASGTFTVGHGLGVAPSMIIMKSRSAAGTDWVVYHSALGNTKYVVLNTTVAAATAAIWNNTSPTSSVFSGNQALLGTSNYVAYCFAAIPGFSAFGSYTGNGSADGPFVYCAFRPKYVMVKRTDTTGDWWIFDSVRNGYNEDKQVLFADLSSAESTATTGIDIVSNGIKFRSSSSDINATSGTYIYMAFAEVPMAYANSR